MKIKPIYIYTGENGVIQTPIKLPMQETKQMIRLISDNGKIMKKGDIESTAIDVEIDDVNNWQEIEKIDDNIELTEDDTNA